MQIYNNEIDKKIELTRGDTALFGVGVKGYDVSSSDTIILTVRDVIGGKILIQKQESATNNFRINPVDTRDIAPGRYVYDIVLRTAAGDRITLFKGSTFELLRGVGND